MVMKEVLEKRKHILGEEYQIKATNNIAIALGKQGKLEKATLIIKEVLGSEK